jgi:hypothetical protein
MLVSHEGSRCAQRGAGPSLVRALRSTQGSLRPDSNPTEQALRDGGP